MSTLEFTGTGGVWEGSAGAADVVINQDPALKFVAANNDEVTIASPNTISSSGAFTLSAWVKPDFADEVRQLCGDATAGEDAFIVMTNATNTSAQIRIAINGNNDDSTSVTVDSSEWMHIAVCRTGTTVYHYINGIAAGTDTCGTEDWELGSIGRAGTGTTYDWNGHIADLRLYNIDLSAAGTTVGPIQTLASKINGAYERASSTQPLAWYKLNEGTGNPADSGSGNKAGVNVGADWVFDQFSVAVQDGGDTTTAGAVTVTQGKLEGLSLSSVDFENSPEKNSIALASTATETTHQTVACWVNPETITGYTYFLGEANNKGIGFYNDARIALSGLGAGTRMFSTTYLTAATWWHFAYTYDGTTTKMYINGVLENSQAEDNKINIARIGSDQSNDEVWDGKIRDVRTYDYALSADQISSLYSGSYNVTPYKWWKLDEGHATAALAEAVGAFSDSGTATAIHGRGAQFSNALASSNGTLDLDSTLTIEAEGTLSAPRGTIDVEGKLVRAGTFTHNNGTFNFTGGSVTYIQDTAMTGSNAFYNLTFTSSGTAWYRIDADIDVEHDLPAASGNQVFWIFGQTVTVGTDTYASGTDAAFGWSHFYGKNGATSKFYGKNSLYPFQIDLSNTSEHFLAGGDVSYMGTSHIKNGNIIGTLTTGGNTKTLILDGDMEFDAVTVSSGDTLDLNGQRMECQGAFIMSGSISGADTGSPQLWTQKFNDGVTANDWGATDVIVTGVPSGSNGGEIDAFINNGCNVYMVNTADDSDAVNFGGTRTINGGDRDAIIVGSGLLRPDGLGSDDFTIATGGTFDARGYTHTIKGDFTTSGGLIGKSALNLTGSSSHKVQFADHFPEVAAENKFTIEGWFKGTNTGATEMLIVRGDRWTTGAVNLYHSSDNTLRLAANDLATNEIQYGTSTRDGKWHHYAGTYDTVTLKLYVDGKLVASAANTNAIAEGTAGHYGSLGVRGSAEYYTGQIGRASIWKNALTQTQIRKMMFIDWTTMAADSDFTDGDAVGWWQFDEGTGADVEDLSSQSNDGTLTGSWADSGTLTWTESGGVPSAGTLNMSGTGTLTYPHGLEFFNLTLAASTKTTTLNSWPTTGKDFHIYGTLAAGTGTIAGTNSPDIMFMGTSTATGNPNFNSASGFGYTHWRSTAAISQMSTKYLMIDSIDATLGGDHINDGYIRPSTNRTLNFGTYTMTTSRFYMGNSNSGLNLQSGNLILSGSSSEANANARLTGGPGCSISSSSSGSRRNMPSNPDWEISGDLTDITIIDDGSWGTGYGLTVVGAVSNCAGQIRQWHHTLDTQQLLDADEKGPDDIKLPNPSLDNALELQTGG